LGEIRWFDQRLGGPLAASPGGVSREHRRVRVIERQSPRSITGVATHPIPMARWRHAGGVIRGPSDVVDRPSSRPASFEWRRIEGEV
jgi:hypothetical protein